MESTEPQLLKEGFWPGIPKAVYHSFAAMPYASRSLLQALVEGYSPAHVLERIIGPKKRTNALEFGGIFDELVLRPKGPLTCLEDFVKIGPTKTRSSKAWEEAQAADPEALMVTEEEFQQLQGMLGALQEHPQAKNILDRLALPDTTVEGSGIWRTTAASEEGAEGIVDTGFPCWCKFRPDVWLGDPERDGKTGLMVDLKSSEDVRSSAFNRSIFKYGYDLQAGFYCEGMKRLGYTVRGYVLLAVEKSPPYGVKVFRLMPDVIEFGWKRIREALRTFAECQHFRNWPSYNPKMEEVYLPTWAENIIFE